MGKPKAPKPPDPKETSAASTSTNVGTAIANAAMGNVNQVTPDGSLTYEQTGTYTWNDPYTGKSYEIPRSTATTTLSPAQQAIADQNNTASLNLSTLAADQSGRLNDLLGRPLDTSNAPRAGTPGQYGSLSSYSGAPTLATSFGDAGQIQTGLADAGDITRTYGTDFSADRKRVEDALMSRLNPSLEQDKANQDAQLAAQGIKLGSRAYGAAQDDRGRTVNDARMSAVLAGGQEQSRLVGLEANRAQFENNAQGQKFGQILNAGTFANSAQQQNYDQLFGRANFGNSATQQNFSNNFQVEAGNNDVVTGNNAISTQRFNEENAARQQWLQEQYAARNQPINEITALTSGAQVQQPQFQSIQQPTIATTDVGGLINENYNQKLGVYQQQMAQSQALLGGLFGLGGKLIGLSDRRAKTDIKQVGKVMGKKVYEYRYRGKFDDGQKHIGVMAQEVEKTNPDAVSIRPDGLRQVDYGAVFGLGNRRAA